MDTKSKIPQSIAKYWNALLTQPSKIKLGNLNSALSKLNPNQINTISLSMVNTKLNLGMTIHVHVFGLYCVDSSVFDNMNQY